MSEDRTSAGENSPDYARVNRKGAAAFKAANRQPGENSPGENTSATLTQNTRAAMDDAATDALAAEVQILTADNHRLACIRAMREAVEAITMECSDNPQAQIGLRWAKARMLHALDQMEAA